MTRKPIEIDCEEVWRHISDYVDEHVDPELRHAMASHFKDCAHCSAILDGTRNVLRLVGDGRAFDLPSGVGKRLYSKLDTHLTKQHSTKR
jgi:hypothetical protein